jgi:hypothetical protein
MVARWASRRSLAPPSAQHMSATIAKHVPNSTQYIITIRVRSTTTTNGFPASAAFYQQHQQQFYRPQQQFISSNF